MTKNNSKKQTVTTANKGGKTMNYDATLLNNWLQSKLDDKKSFVLTNELKESIVITAGTTTAKEFSIPVQSIVSLIIVDTVRYILNKQLGVEVELDIKNKQIVVKNLNKVAETLTTKQKRYYNTNLNCNFSFTSAELEAEKAEENAEKTELYAEISNIYGQDIASILL